MEKFIVTTDSGCDLSGEYCESLGIVPLKMCWTAGEENITDTMVPTELKAFYDGMRSGTEPKTSQVTPYQYIEFWTPLLERKLPIVHIALGSAISGTYANGVKAAEMMREEHPDCVIHVVDSTLASVGYGMLAINAAKMRDEGFTPEQCVDELERTKASVNTIYTTGDLTYLYRSGRVSRTGMVVAHALNIWPILRLDIEGTLLVTAKERGKKHTLDRINKIIEEAVLEPEKQTLYICHSDIPEEAHEFGESLKELFGFKDVFYTYIGTTIGSNCGPGLMAAFFTGKDRTK